MNQEDFSQGPEILQIKEGRPNFLGEPILQNVWIISSPLLYLNLKSFLTQILRHLLAYKAFCMIQEYLSQGFQISTN